jgi:aryl-alcohol dehydrogenase-like predicted oxidoreductase
MLPIPGTSKVSHLEENVAAVNVVLSDEEFGALDREGKLAAYSAESAATPPNTITMPQS